MFEFYLEYTRTRWRQHRAASSCQDAVAVVPAMRATADRKAFGDVVVGLPSKVRGSEAEEEWQEVDWITWSTGELSVDADSFLLVFEPQNSGVRAKPLGHLIEAKPLASQDGGKTLVVTTSDTLHRVIRFTFRDTRDAGDFAQLAKKAAEKEAVAAKQAEGRCKSASSEAIPQLEAKVQKHLASNMPLVFAAAELYGPDPEGTPGNEVLLGRGVLALVDPPGSEKTLGCYELQFFSEDEGVRNAAKRFVIGPKMELKRQKNEDQIDGDGPAASFLLPAHRGTPAHTIAFDRIDVADSFARDYRVRQRLMEVANKTALGKNQADQLRGEIQDMKQRSLTMKIWRLLCVVLVLIVIFCVVRAAMLYAEDKTRPLPELIQAVLSDIMSFSRTWRSLANQASNKVCQLAVGTVPAEKVRMCAAITGEKQVQACISDLVG